MKKDFYCVESILVFHALVIACFASTTFAQTIHVNKDTKLILGLDDKILTEHHLSVHPNEASYLLLSGMFIDSKDTMDYRNFSSVSFDKGRTWQQPHVFDVKMAADPWAEISPSGAAVFSVLSNDLLIYHSKNAGMEWIGEATSLGQAHDHQTIIIDEQDDIIYVVSIQGNSIFVVWSDDGGLQFSKPATFKFSSLNTNTMVPVVQSDGTLLISYTTFQRTILNDKGQKNGEFLKNSLDWIISYDRKTNSFGTPSLISESCERGFPVLAIDKSNAKFKDRLYYVCSNQTKNEILFHYSNDKGKTWTSAKPVRKFHNKPPERRNRFTGIPQITVNRNGIIGVAWQDRIDDLTGKCQYLYFTASIDGGQNFLDPVRVSSELSCMKRKENFWAGIRYPSGGDYFGFVSDHDGTFILTWPDSRSGNSQLYGAEIKVTDQD